jgi:hypothetical protein
MYADERVAAPPQRTRRRRRRRRFHTTHYRHHRPCRFPGRYFPSARPPNQLSGGSWPTLRRETGNSARVSRKLVQRTDLCRRLPKLSLDSLDCGFRSLGKCSHGDWIPR